MTSNRFSIEHKTRFTSAGLFISPEHEKLRLLVTYTDKCTSISFAAIQRLNTVANQISWTLSVPVDARQRLGSRWKDRHEIYNRVLAYLREIEDPEILAASKVPLAQISVDESNVRSWFEHNKLQCKKACLPITSSLPSPAISLLLVVGMLCVWYQDRKLSVEFAGFIGYGLILIGVASLVLQLRDVQRSWNTLRTLSFARRMSDKTYDWRADCIKALFRLYGRRGVVTMSFGVFFIWMGVSIVLNLTTALLT